MNKNHDSHTGELTSGGGGGANMDDFKSGGRLSLGGDTTPQQAAEAWNKLGLNKPPVAFVDHTLSGTIVGATGIEVTVSEDGNKLTVSHSLVARKDGEYAGAISHTYSVDGHSVELSAMMLSRDYQNRKIAGRFMTNAVAEWRASELSPIEVHAGLDTGGYTWARFGFVPDAESWAELQGEIQSRAQRMLGQGQMTRNQHLTISALVNDSNEKNLGRIADTPHGKALLRGTQWHGTLHAYPVACQ